MPQGLEPFQKPAEPENIEILTPEKLKAQNAPTKLWVWTNKYGETVSTLRPGFEKEAKKIECKYSIEVPDEVMEICREVNSLGGKALLVGGCVRDAVISSELKGFNLKPKDFDVEIYGLSRQTLNLILETKFGGVRAEGKSFAVLKVPVKGLSHAIDASIPRRESKTGKGHTGFDIEGDPTMSISEAALRRDLTINSLAYDPLSETLYDAYNGVEHIKKGVIEVTNEEAFQEDPLRVLRVMQFASRFEFSISENTIKLCKEMVQRGDLDELPPSRIIEEINKLFTKGRKPSIGLEFAREVGITKRYWPEAHALIGVEQDKKWHPEGDVWRHTLQVVDAAAQIAERELANNRLISDQELLLVADRAKNRAIQISREEKYRFIEELLRSEVPNGMEMLSRIEEVSSNAGRGMYKSVLRSKATSGKKRSDEEWMHLALETSRKAAIKEKWRELDVALKSLPESLRGRVGKREQQVFDQNYKTEYSEEYESMADNNRLVLCLSALAHDFGKPSKTKPEDGTWKARGHEIAGVEPATIFLNRIYKSKGEKDDPSITKKVAALISVHLAPKYYWEQEVKHGHNMTKAINRCSVKLGEAGTSIYMLSLLAEADQRGRNPNITSTEPLPRDQVDELEEWQTWLINKTTELKVTEKPPERLLKGQYLLDVLSGKLGGVWLGCVLKAVYADQLDGVVQSPQEALSKGLFYNEMFSRVVKNLADQEGVHPDIIWSKLKQYEDPRVILQSSEIDSEAPQPIDELVVAV